MQRRTLVFCFAAMAAAAGTGQAQPTEIDHKAVACIVVAKYPKLKACFGAEVTESRAYFHAEGVRDWFWVKMGKDAKDAPQPGCYAGILPRPSRKLIHKHIEYYLEVVDKGQRTPKYDALVVRQARECKKDATVAPVSPNGPVAVFPAMPAGFTIGAFPTAAVGVATAAAAGTGVYFATRKDQTPASTPAPPAPAPPAPVPPTPVTPAPTSPLGLSCQAEPRSGRVPLTVTFTAFASGGTGSYDYDWRFGDGASAVGRHPVHTYTSTGTFDMVLIVTSGDQVRRCERSITVNAPPPPPPPSTPPSNFTLSVAIIGSGGGIVTDDKGKINCRRNGPTCSATYLNGTQVSLIAASDPPFIFRFSGWSGDCSGGPSDACVLTMDRDRSVTAQFDIPPAIPVTLTFTAVDETGAKCGQPRVKIDRRPGEDCVATNPPGTTCSYTFVLLPPDHFGIDMKLTADDRGCKANICWSGDCFGSFDTCNLLLFHNSVAGVKFTFGSCGASAEPPVILTWSFALDVPGAIGHAVVDGEVVVAESGQRAQQTVRNREGEAVVAGNLVKADGKPGTWRFEAQQGEAIEPGSLRVLQGDVALLTPTAVVFRLKGDAGEQVAFSYRLRR